MNLQMLTIVNNPLIPYGNGQVKSLLLNKNVTFAVVFYAVYDKEVADVASLCAGRSGPLHPQTLTLLVLGELHLLWRLHLCRNNRHQGNDGCGKH